MKVQVVFDEDVRDWQHPETYKYDDLQKFILKSFDLSQDDIGDVIIEYIDDENDFVRIACDEDLHDAFECANNQFTKSLKLFVKTQRKKNNQKNTESNSDDNWREIALDFLENKEIELLLPEFFRCVIISLRNEQLKGNDCKQDSESKSDDEDFGKKDLITILVEILSLDKFKAILNHKLIEIKLPIILDIISSKFGLFFNNNSENVLFLFDENEIVELVPQCIKLLIYGLKEFENVQFDVDCGIDDDDANGIESFIPQLFAFVNTKCNGNYNNEDNEYKNGVSVHNGVECDECGEYPIIGSRFKCTICKDYDLCNKCALLKKHDLNHPMIKFDVPFNKRSLNKFAFDGLDEIFGTPHGGYHYHHHHHRRHRGPRGYWHSYHGHPHHSEFYHFASSLLFPHGIRRERRGADCGGMCFRRPHSFGDVNVNVNVNGGKRRERRRRQRNRRANDNNNNVYDSIDKNINLLNEISRCAMFDEQELKKQMTKNTKGDKSDISCICGEKLLYLQTYEAYPNGTRSGEVKCDVCDRNRVNHSYIYHCPNNKSLIHPNGYDICTRCVSLQEQSFKIDENVNRKNVNVEQEEKKTFDNDDVDDVEDGDHNEEEHVSENNKQENTNEIEDIIILTGVLNDNGSEDVKENKMENDSSKDKDRNVGANIDEDAVVPIDDDDDDDDANDNGTHDSDENISDSSSLVIIDHDEQ